MDKVNLNYLKHALQAQMLQREDVMRRAAYLPTCARCERLALRDRRKDDPKDKPVFVTCPVCGYHGPGGPPMRIVARG